MSKRCKKIYTVKKERAISKKKQKKESKIELTAFTEFNNVKGKTRQLSTAHRVRKITSKRLTVRPLSFESGVRSEVIPKEQISNLRDESKALLNEDLFQLIDLGNKKDCISNKGKSNSTIIGSIIVNHCKTSTVTSNIAINNQFGNQRTEVASEKAELSVETEVRDKKADLKSENIEISEKAEEENTSKSIFRQIQQRYDLLLKSKASEESHCDNNYLISDNDLKAAVLDRLHNKKKVILNFWGSTFRNFLFHRNVKDYKAKLCKDILNSQIKINSICVMDELNENFNRRLIPASFRRRFVRRLNQMIASQDIGAESVSFLQADELIRWASLTSSEIGAHNPEDTEVEFLMASSLTPEASHAIQKRSLTPENEKSKAFPDGSYRTPKNQRFVCSDSETELSNQTRLKPGIFVFSKGYRSAIRDNIDPSTAERMLSPRTLSQLSLSPVASVKDPEALAVLYQIDNRDSIFGENSCKKFQSEDFTLGGHVCRNTNLAKFGPGAREKGGSFGDNERGSSFHSQKNSFPKGSFEPQKNTNEIRCLKHHQENLCANERSCSFHAQKENLFPDERSHNFEFRNVLLPKKGCSFRAEQEHSFTEEGDSVPEPWKAQMGLFHVQERPKKLFKTTRSGELIRRTKLIQSDANIFTGSPKTEPRRRLNYHSSSHVSPRFELQDGLEPVPLFPERNLHFENREKISRSDVERINLKTEYSSGRISPLEAPDDYRSVLKKYRLSKSPQKMAPVKFSPNEYSLRKKYAPHTLKIDELDEEDSDSSTNIRSGFMTRNNFSEMPKAKLTPDLKYQPRFQH